METVCIGPIAVAYPEHWVEQVDAARHIAAVNGDPRRVNAVARGTKIDRRATALAPAEMHTLGSIEARNRVYQRIAPELALSAARSALETSRSRPPIGCVVTTSCTGYMVPGFDVLLAQDLGLAPDTVRLPITQAGCAGGVVALARATDYLRAHPGQSALVVSVELCSLAFQPDTEAGNLMSALIFGDGAAAAVLESTAVPGDGLEVVDALSTLVPCSRDALGFDLTDRGFYPLLTRDLADLLPAPTFAAADRLLARNGLSRPELDFWLVHPGGARILSALESALASCDEPLRWSWASLRDAGNTSSAAIFDVTRRYLADSDAPRGWGIVVAFGPGVSIELLLVRR